MDVVLEGEVKVFRTGDGRAAATARARIERPSGSMRCLGSFELAREDGQWKLTMFRL
jgi:hypothetical protein